MVDPAQTYIDSGVQLGRDVTLLPGVILEGMTTIGDAAVLGPFARLRDCEVQQGAIVEQTTAAWKSSAQEATIGKIMNDTRRANLWRSLLALGRAQK